MAVIVSRKIVLPSWHGPTVVAITFSGSPPSGSDIFAKAVIGGTTYTAAATGIEVRAGDVITFGVVGLGQSSRYAKVVIDGETVVSSISTTMTTYAWTVPEKIAEISIQLTAEMYGTTYYGTITVTTTAA